MENVETKSGFRVARTITTVIIGLLVVASFVIFGRFQVQSKHLLESYQAYVNSMGPGTSVYTILRTAFILF